MVGISLVDLDKSITLCKNNINDDSLILLRQLLQKKAYKKSQNNAKMLFHTSVIIIICRMDFGFDINTLKIKNC
jgi:hypothetical protein